jgi:hypothetical protein
MLLGGLTGDTGFYCTESDGTYIMIGGYTASTDIGAVNKGPLFVKLSISGLFKYAIEFN